MLKTNVKTLKVIFWHRSQFSSSKPGLQHWGCIAFFLPMCPSTNIFLKLAVFVVKTHKLFSTKTDNAILKDSAMFLYILAIHLDSCFQNIFSIWPILDCFQSMYLFVHVLKCKHIPWHDWNLTCCAIVYSERFLPQKLKNNCMCISQFCGSWNILIHLSWEILRANYSFAFRLLCEQ